MKIVLIDFQENMPPLGLAYLASYLNTHLEGHETTIILKDFMEVDNNIQLEARYNELSDEIKAAAPDLVGIRSVTADYHLATKVASFVKETCNVPVILGGPHISALPDTLATAYDVGVIGEGEQAFLELIALVDHDAGFDKKSLNDIKGIVYHDTGSRTVRTAPRTLITDMDKIPFPARDLCDMRSFTAPKQVFNSIRKVTHVMTSRGCPYKCVFCSARNMWTQKVRFFSTEYVVQEMRTLIKEWGLDAIHIYDDLFMASKKRVRAIAETIENDPDFKGIEFYAMAKTNMLNEEMIKLFKRMNFKGLSFGFESMTEKTLKYLKKDSATVEDNYRAISLCKEYDIECSGSFIIGAPEETREEMIETVNAIKRERITADIYPLTPLPGTELWFELEREGKVSNQMDWQLFSINNFKHDRFFFVNNRMEKKEFVELLHRARNEVASFANLKFDVKYLLDARLIMKMIGNPRRYFGLLCNFIGHKLRALLTTA